MGIRQPESNLEAYMFEQNDMHDDMELSIYELYCQLVEPEQAKHLTRYLMEFCHCDPNTYPFLHGLLMVTHLRVGVNLPKAVVERIAAPLAEFQVTAQALTETVSGRHAALRSQKNSQSGWWAWPLGKQYSNKIAVCFQTLVKQFEDVVAHRVRWLVLAMLSASLMLCFQLFHNNQLTIKQVKDQYAGQVDALNTAEAAERSALQEQYLASVEQKADELANTKLQNLEPRSYHLAKQLEAVSHRVKFSDQSFGWEVKIVGSTDLPSFQITYDNNLTRSVLFYIKEETSRVDLSATAPAASPSKRNQTNGKPSQ